SEQHETPDPLRSGAVKPLIHCVRHGARGHASGKAPGHASRGHAPGPFGTRDGTGAAGQLFLPIQPRRRNMTNRAMTASTSVPTPKTRNAVSDPSRFTSQPRFWPKNPV